MKISGMFYVAVTTLLLVTLTIMVAMDMSFTWVFYVMILGQVLVAVMVYKVLRDNYSTDKTFEDFYEDHPIGKQEITLQ
jgi:membrane protein implicated in regulation of membrane protease activity